MIDYQNLQDNAKVDWFLQPTSTNEMHTWTKPAGCNFVYMIAVGAGGSGGNGFSRAAGSPGGGGGSGGHGQLHTLLVPSFLIPDTLFIRVGKGGSGVASTSTIISAYRVLSNNEYYLNALGGISGGNGTSTSGGGGGTGSTAVISQNALGSIAKWQGVSSGGGTAGGGSGGANGTAVSLNFFLSGGGSGAGTTSGDFSGGSVTSTYNQPASRIMVQGGAAVLGATVGQNDGGDGFWIPKRFAFFGGGGGGASNTGVGGNGGKGAFGCGGGGGGAGVTGGIGGDGGDGFALIISY